MGFAQNDNWVASYRRPDLQANFAAVQYSLQYSHRIIEFAFWKLFPWVVYEKWAAVFSKNVATFYRYLLSKISTRAVTITMVVVVVQRKYPIMSPCQARKSMHAAPLNGRGAEVCEQKQQQNWVIFRSANQTFPIAYGFQLFAALEELAASFFFFLVRKQWMCVHTSILSKKKIPWQNAFASGGAFANRANFLEAWHGLESINLQQHALHY